MLDILDSLIATIGVVLVLSLIVQAMQQIIKQAGSFKSKYMERELLAMFQLLPAKEETKNAFLRGVSWFFRGLYNLLVPASLEFRIGTQQDTSTKELIQQLKNKLASLGYNDLSLLETMKKKDFQKMLSALDVDQKRLTQWKKDVNDWYDLTLKAFQDHYERRMKIWSYVLSFVVVVWLNQNLFDIYKEFSGNKTLRDSAVKMAERLAAIPKDSLIIVTVKGKKDSLIKVPDSLARKEIERQIGRINTMVNDSSFHIMRWNAPNGNKMTFSKFLGMEIVPSWENLVDGFGRNVMGWLAMTFLVGLGAPFWYDTLQAIMGIKKTLNKQGDKK